MDDYISNAWTNNNNRPLSLPTNPNLERVLIPKLPVPMHEIEYECEECGMIFKGAMGYVCSNPRCPVFPVITCSTDLKQVPVSGGWF